MKYIKKISFDQDKFNFQKIVYSHFKKIIKLKMIYLIYMIKFFQKKYTSWSR